MLYKWKREQKNRYAISSSPFKLIGGQKVIFSGHSYGTFLVHRFVQMYPKTVSRVILDSTLVGPKGNLMDITMYTEKQWLNSVRRITSANSNPPSFYRNARTTLSAVPNLQTPRLSSNRCWPRKRVVATCVLHSFSF